MKEKRSEEYEVLEEVFDKPTLMTIYHFLNKRTIEEIFGVVKSGKEARVYWGRDAEGNELAIKIYLTVSAMFKRGKLPYIEGDPRFKHVKHDTRSLVYVWALKEFKNLQLAFKAKAKVPKPIAIRKNVLIMQFIGKNGVPAPLLKDFSPKNPEKVYNLLVTHVERLYKKARLIHGDLSEYNVMIWRQRPVIFDISQAVLTVHPMADEFLRRDLKNLNRWFKRLDVEVLSEEELYERVTDVKSK